MPDDKQSKREQEDRAMALLFLAFASALDELEAEIRKGWEQFARAANADTQNTRGKLLGYVQDLDFDDQTLNSGYSQTLAVQNRFDSAARSWSEEQRGRLGIHKAKSRTGERSAVLVAGALLSAERGGAAKMTRSMDGHIDKLALSISRAIKDADPETAKRIKGYAGKSRSGTVLSARSWVENIGLALESAIHVARAPIIDATTGPMRKVAVREAALKFSPPMQRLELSYKTHQRAAMRSALAEMGQTAGATSFLYYLPAMARGEVSADGFGASQYGKIRTAAAWDILRRKRGAKRAGSYIFSTGFHVGDLGYLLPVFPLLASSTVQHARQMRQEFLNDKRGQ